MAPKVPNRRNKKPPKTFFCDSCLLHVGNLDRHDTAVHRPSPSMYRKNKILKRIFSPKLKKIESKKDSSDLKCYTCQLYVPSQQYMKHLIQHDHDRQREAEDMIAKRCSNFSDQCIYISDDDEIDEFHRRRFLYPRHDPRFNGPDSMLECLDCDSIFMTLSKFKSHTCPAVQKPEVEEMTRRRYLYPKNDPRFNTSQDSMLTCLTCNGIFGTNRSFESHECPASQTSFVSLDLCSVDLQL